MQLTRILNTKQFNITIMEENALDGDMRQQSNKDVYE